MEESDVDAAGIPFPGFLSNPDFASLLEAHAGLAAELKGYDPAKLTAYIGGLLTSPEWQASTLRLEVLQHFAVATAAGSRDPKSSNLKSWLTELGAGIAGRMEDPSEDVFVSRVILPERDCLIFEGIYESAAFYLQRFLNFLQKMPVTEPYAGLRRSADSLLRLSQAVAERAGLKAHVVGQIMPLRSVPNRLVRTHRALAQHVLFTSADLEALGISINDLRAFIFDPEERRTIAAETLGHSTLERFPVLWFDNHLCLALPNAVSIAIRRMIIDFSISADQTKALYGSYAREMADTFKGMPLLGGRPAPAIPFRKEGGIYIADMVTKIDEGRCLHFCFIVDNFDTYSETGMAGMNPDLSRLAEIVDQSIVEAHRTHAAEDGFKEGISLVVVCPWGRLFAVGFNGIDDKRWRVETVSAADLDSISWVPGFSPLKFWRLLDSRDSLQQVGVELVNANGLLNLYAWSEENSGHLVPHGDVPEDQSPSGHLFVVVTQNGLLEVRKEGAEAWNVHHAKRWDGQNVIVRRETPKSFFKEKDPVPLYVSMDDVDKGEMVSVFEARERGWWTTAEMLDASERNLEYRLWHVTAVWIARAAPVLEESMHNLPAGPLLWVCRFEERDLRDPKKHIPTLEEARALLEVTVEGNVIRTTALDGFLASFRNPTNIGESLLVESLIVGACRLNGDTPSTDQIAELVSRIVPDEWARDMHSFETLRFRHFVQDSVPNKAILISKMDDAYSRIGLGWRKRQREAGSRVTGVDECCAYLNSVIDSIWEDTRSALKGYNREKLVMRLVGNHECIMKETDQWNRTARAILALNRDHAQAVAASIDRISRFNGGALSTRILIEIALCECPEEEGAVAGVLDIARLLAHVMQMHYLGGWSEAIKYGAKKAEIRITPFGDIHTQVEFDEAIATPYGQALGGRRFRKGAESYEDNFKHSEVFESAEHGFGEEFWYAWKEAYGFTIDELRLFMDNLENEGIKRKSFAFVARHDELCSLWGNAPLSREIVNKILAAFTSVPRPSWAIAPEGYSPRDWYPWRFRRRLSVIARPMLQLNASGDPRYLVAPGMFRDGAVKVIDYCFHGGFDAKDYPPGRMRSWIGAAENKRGNQFNLEVSERLKELGWQTKANVRLDEILMKKLDRDYGDVDVLAWRCGRVLAIECKDLELAMTIGEIARQLHGFRGESDANGKPDRLRRHLLRADILRSRIAEIARFTKMTGKISFEVYLLFSDIVPMSYSEVAARHDVSLTTIDQADKL